VNDPVKPKPVKPFGWYVESAGLPLARMSAKQRAQIIYAVAHATSETDLSGDGDSFEMGAMNAIRAIFPDVAQSFEELNK